MISDLAEFGPGELRELARILKIMAEVGLPDCFFEHDLKPCMDDDNGRVYLMNCEGDRVYRIGKRLKLQSDRPGMEKCVTLRYQGIDSKLAKVLRQVQG